MVRDGHVLAVPAPRELTTLFTRPDTGGEVHLGVLDTPRTIWDAVLTCLPAQEVGRIAMRGEWFVSMTDADAPVDPPRLRAAVDQVADVVWGGGTVLVRCQLGLKRSALALVRLLPELAAEAPTRTGAARRCPGRLPGWHAPGSSAAGGRSRLATRCIRRQS